jgi:hypothetical protein
LKSLKKSALHNAKLPMAVKIRMQNALFFPVARGRGGSAAWHKPCYLLRQDQCQGRAMNCILRRLTTAFLLTLAITSSFAQTTSKETPSSVDTLRHTTAVGNAIAQAAGVQQLVAAYHERTNNFPGSNAEAGVKPAASLATPDTKSIEVTSGGVVVVTLTATSGNDGGTVVFTPTVSNSDENLLAWTCKSPSISTISDDTGGVCEYSKLP